jgi:predicted acylesterase/phospholipase RssA
MAIKNFSYSRLALSFLACAALSACQTANRKPQPRMSGVEVNVPPTAGAPAEAPSQQPVPSREEPKKVAVILGPGGAKAMAHVGVLHAFQQQRIPIGKIVGLEWGALVGALYASKGQVHDVEWKLYKMEQKNLPRPKGFFSKRLGEDSFKIMDDYMQDAFGNEDIAGDKIPFSCPSRSMWSGVITWQNRGPAREAMKRCVPFPPLFKAQGTFIAAADAATEAVELLRAEGYNVIILVNVLGSAMPVGQDSLLENLNYVILWQEIKRATLEAVKLNVEVVNVDTSSASTIAFDSKKDLISLGELAGAKAAGAMIGKYGF